MLPSRMRGLRVRPELRFLHPHNGKAVMVSNWQPMRREVFVALAATYFGLVLYGILAELTGVLTVFISYGPVWGQAWPLLLLAASVFALVGMYRTVKTKKYGVEFISTVLLVALLLSYSGGIVIRGVAGGAPWDRAPYALFPIIISIAPYVRLITILPRRKG